MVQTVSSLISDDMVKLMIRQVLKISGASQGNQDLINASECTLQIAVFADGISRIRRRGLLVILLIFRGWEGLRIKKQRKATVG